MVAKARQKTANPAVKNGEGWEIPCQPCLNSSINFVIVVVISRDQRIQNKAERGGFPGFLRERSRQAGSPAAGGPDQLACLVPGGREYCVQARSTGGTDMGRLDGKVAVITGATSGIGLHTAEIFVAEGAKIVIAGRRAPEGEALAKKLGANCIFRQTDVTVEAQMKALIALSVEKFGRIDCLFNNAGGPAQIGGIEGLDVDRFDAAMATLLRSVMLGMKHAAPHMKKQGSGSIINNGSIAGRLAGFSSSIVYGAAKAGVIHLTKCVAMELGESNIRVNSISPGVIATGIFGKALGLSVEAAERTPAVMREVTKTAQPIPRAGLPEDIAHAAVFLASDESSFINGHDLVVDGAITGGRNWSQQQQGYVDMRKRFDQG
jgi:NAD(P)-dependent dehydrogenase (short-subunit alcohol dehydrogenase family)